MKHLYLLVLYVLFLGVPVNVVIFIISSGISLNLQDFTENMQRHRDNKNYSKWNLENTARIIHRGFLDSHVIVVRPSR